MPCRFASSGTVATSRSASRAILALNAASNFLRDLVISVLHRLRQSRTLHTLTFGPISGVHFRHPVLKTYITPFITSRTSTWRRLPPRLAAGINDSTSAHSSSLRSLGYRNWLRSQRPRFFAVHIGAPPSNQVTPLESQTIHMIQYVFGRTLRQTSRLRRGDVNGCARRRDRSRVPLIGMAANALAAKIARTTPQPRRDRAQENIYLGGASSP